MRLSHLPTQWAEEGNAALKSWAAKTLPASGNGGEALAAVKESQIRTAAMTTRTGESRQVLQPRTGPLDMDFIYAPGIAFAGAILFLLVDKYKKDAHVAKWLKLLIVLVISSIAMLHRLQPLGIEWF
jgi:hypothetical protein